MRDNKTIHQLAAAASQRTKEKGYWLIKLSGEWVKSSLPYDYPKRSDGGYRLETAAFEFSFDLSSVLLRLIRGSDVQLYIFMLAGLNVLLYRYMSMNTSTLSDTEPGANKNIAAEGADIVVGTPILKSAKEANLINTLLVLRTAVNSRMTFKELVLETRQTAVEAIENMNYPLEVLLRQLNVPHSPGDDFPLFDIALLLENIHDREYLNHVNLDMIFSFTRCGSSIKGRLEYNPLLYRETTIEQIISCYKNLLREAAANTDITLSDIDIISEKEKKQLLVDFNDTSVEYPRDKTIHELFAEQAKRTPNHIAIVGAQHAVPLNGNIHLTYKELDKKSDQLAHVLRKKGVKPDTIVGLMVKRSLEMVIGLLGILKAGGAYLPIDPDYPEERKKYMLADCNAALLLTARELLDVCRGTACRASICQDTAWGAAHPAHKGAPTNLAYIIYTSGSTGRPKGVLVEQQNVVRLVKNTNYIEFRDKERILQTGALEFDASTFEIWGALLNGLTLYLVPEDEILIPGRLKENIGKFDISTMWLTSPLFNRLCGEDVEIFAGLKNLLVGGDVLSPVHINQVRERFPGLNILNGYGPTENTTFSTTYLITKSYKERIPIGKPIANSTAYILDRCHNLVPVGVVGKLYVGGDGVSRGYLNNPELTAERFISISYGSYRTYKTYISKRIYKTGDLARWLADGNIEFIGRMDHQVKIRGFRIEPGEIESRLLSHRLVKEAAVLVREDSSGDKYLCAYVVAGPAPQQTFSVPELREYLSRDLPGYMVPGYIITLYRMPLTLNGKVDRAALPIPEVGAAAQYAYTAPRDRLEQTLVELWSEVLKVNHKHLGIDANFIEMGGHSLKATLLVSKIHKAFAVDVPLAEIFTRPTIRELAGYIRAAKPDKYLSIEPGELKDYYPLSSAQKRLYILQQLDVNSTAYNIPEFMVLAGNLETDRLECTFKALIARHESLRTSFEMIRDNPVQRIHDEAAFAIDYNDRKLPTDFIRPFDLSRAPLFRVGLIKEEDMKYILMVDMHHIIADGTSIGVFTREFMVLYEGEDLPPVRIQYKNFSEWQNSEREKEAIKMQERYWLKEFAGEMPVLNLPLDYARPVIQDFAGNTIPFQIGREQTQKLKVLIVKEDTSLYMVLLTLYNILLSKLSGQEDIVVGSPAAGRKHGDLENVIGMFVNTLALRNYPAAEKRVIEFLREVRERTLTAFKNQDYPFEDLVEKAAVNRDTGRNPLFDTMLALQNIEISELEIPDLKLASYNYERVISKFDISWDCVELEESLFFFVTYCTKLFKVETIERFIRYFKRTVTYLLENPETRISDIEIITEDEKEEILYRFNDTCVEYSHEKTVYKLFAEQASRSPDSVAAAGSRQWAVGKGEKIRETVQLTYRELNGKANQLAHVLRKRGVAPDTVVALMVEPSSEMIIAIMGILKAGGAYLPIDPGYPEERINFMLRDSTIRILLAAPAAQVKVEVKVKEEPIEIIDISKGFSSLTLTSTLSKISPANLAYVIYTSGTTGRPKGVAVEHRNLMVYLNAFESEFNLQPDDIVIQQASFTFDAFVEEFYPILLKGGKLVVPSREIVRDMGALSKFIAKHHVTLISCSPLMLNEINKQEPTGIKTFISGGDELKGEYVSKLIKEGVVYNTYGPTETTVCTVYYKCRGSDPSNIPIGKPITGYSVYIMSGDTRHMMPVGIPGELCIGGEGVTRGYLNRPELTAEKFLFISYKSYRTYRTYRSKKIYRTGDLGRWLPDGNIEFLGRIDRQVKIRGYRIELGEIENRLLARPEVKAAVVMDRSAGDGRGKYICAYVVIHSLSTDHSSDISQLREYLAHELPGYMIPSYFIKLDSIPLTPNGKVDRKALPVPENTRSYLKTTYVQPETEMEKIVAGTWKEVLGVDIVGLNDNFFELGGNSLNIVQLTGKLKKSLGRDIPIVTMFRFPKISSFLEYLNGMVESEEKEEVKIGVSGKGRSDVIERGKNIMKRSIQKRRRQ